MGKIGKPRASATWGGGLRQKGGKYDLVDWSKLPYKYFISANRTQLSSKTNKNSHSHPSPTPF
jgi:hypothetical protein